jgi:predicted alpha/beta-hydrolase family hydrolase
MPRREIRISVSERAGSVSGLIDRPRGARALLVLGHGAGADMHHRFMEAASDALVAEGIAVLRYQFPYAEAGRRMPDHRTTLLAGVRAALAAGAKAARGIPLLAGGKSMGGRMTSLLIAEEGAARVRGLVFFGFPLHASGKPSDERGAHLASVETPLLFLQGARDKLADLDLLKPLVKKLGRRARVHEVPDADHSFHVPKRSGRTDEDVILELARTTAEWIDGLPA